MQFHVGPYIYRLVISDTAIFDADGAELDGLASEVESEDQTTSRRVAL
jgi:hypothetical protein